MQYHMHIESEESITVYNQGEKVFIEKGEKYIIDPGKATNKKDRKNKGRIVYYIGHF